MSSSENMAILPGLMRRWWLWAVLLAAGLAAWSYALPADAPRAWRAVLINFIYFCPLAAGMALWPAIVTLARGRWTGPYAPTAMAAVGFGPVSLATLAVLWRCWPQWATWSDPARQGLGFWLDPNFIFIRDLASLAVLWVLTLWFICARRRGGGGVSSVLAVVWFCLAFTLIAGDLVMGLDVHWYSTLFGGYFFMSALLTAVAGWALLTLWRMTELQRVRDMGNLVLAFSILTTYMMFSQLLPIWFENLPQEVRFVTVRMNPPWQLISVVLLATVYVGPLALLIWRGVKWHRLPMMLVSLYVLAGTWIERWWEVTPTVGGRPVVGLAELGMALAFISAMVLSMAVAARFLGPSSGCAARVAGVSPARFPTAGGGCATTAGGDCATGSEAKP